MMSVNSLFFDAVKAAATTTPVAFPNISYTANTEYYRVFVVPAQKEGVGVSKVSSQNGFCQVSCFVRDGEGEIKAIALAEKIIASFPMGTKLKSESITIEINKPAYYSGGMNTNNGWYMIPVTIPYTQIAK